MRRKRPIRLRMPTTRISRWPLRLSPRNLPNNDARQRTGMRINPVATCRRLLPLNKNVECVSHRHYACFGKTVVPCCAQTLSCAGYCENLCSSSSGTSSNTTSHPLASRGHLQACHYVAVWFRRHKWSRCGKTVEFRIEQTASHFIYGGIASHASPTSMSDSLQRRTDFLGHNDQHLHPAVFGSCGRHS